MFTQATLIEEIASANRRLMDLFQQDDASGVGACYTDDAQLLVSHMEPFKGRATIQAVWKSTMGHGHTLDFQTWELEGDESSALDIGQYTRLDSTGATLDRGKYIVLWKRVAGDWKLHRDMLNTSLPKSA